MFALMEIEGPLNKLSVFFKGILKKKGDPASLIKEALHELEVLETNIVSFGLKVRKSEYISKIFNLNKNLILLC